jgi:dUTP pyrophosphatase
MINPEQFDFYNEKIKEMDDIMNLDLDDNLDEYDEIMNELGIDMKDIQLEFDDYTPKLELGYTKLHDDAVEPKYNYESDSGFDLHSTEEIVIPPFGRTLVPTGISLDINDGFEIQVRSKSGLALNQGLMCLNSPGTVDNGYTGEVKAIIFNTNKEPFTITKGMKVAQAVLCPVVNGKWVDLVNKQVVTEKERGDNGFGSTGIK